MKKLQIAVQMDAFEKLDAPIDSTILIMRAAYQRGYQLFIYQPAFLRWQSDGTSGQVLAQGAMITHWDDTALLPTLSARTEMALADYDVVLMRQDPPFDMAYITATYVLELLPPSVLLINNPRAVRDAPEKLFIARYPDLLPPTLVSHDCAAIADFQAQHGRLVLKPLYGFGAVDIALLQADDDTAVIEAYKQQQNGLPFIAQKFIPGVIKGDKRIVLIDGQIAGAVNRMPQEGEFLANIHAGGYAMPTTVTPHEAAMVARFAGDLNVMGILLAGVDVIDGFVTEINVTCPSAMVVAASANGLTGAARLEEKLWDAIVRRLAA